MNKLSNILVKQKKPAQTTAFFVCLIIASILWILQALNTIYNYSITIPVIFKNLPYNKTPLTSIPSQVTIDVKASGLKLALILTNQPFNPVEIDFNNLKSDNKHQNFILTSSSIDFKKSLKFALQIKRINPDTLYFGEKNGYQKIVPIKIPLSIRCIMGYGFKPVVFQPSCTTIFGDTSIINRIDTIFSEPLSLVDLKQDYTTNLSLIKPNSNITIADLGVNVFIQVAKLVEHTITLPINVSNAQDYKQVAIFPSKVNVKFTYLQSNDNNFDSLMFGAYVNPLTINRNNKCNIVLSKIPKVANVISFEPKEVEVLIIKK